ncbi:hypothetical protein C0J45_17260 [Silurus meridionalis]|nr:hypothetical protein C0J45_17260 [Silurus meridionalis]
MDQATARNLGVTMANRLSFFPHVANVARFCRFVLYNIRRIRPFLSTQAAQPFRGGLAVLKEACHEARQDPASILTGPHAVHVSSISLLHLTLTHLDNKDTYVQMMFIDFSSAFNTIIPQHLIEKLSLLGLNTSLCTWILDFMTGRPQSIRIRNSTSTSTTTLSTKAPQGCVITSSSSPMTRPWWVSSARTMSQHAERRRVQSDHSPLIIDGSSVEIVKSTKFLGVHLEENPTWSLNTSSITKKSQQCLYFLRRLKKALCCLCSTRVLEKRLISLCTASAIYG